MAAHVQAGKQRRAGFHGLIALGLLSLLQACASSAGLSGVDRDTVTGSVNRAKPEIAADALSDELTIRNAVSSADLSRPGPLAWANRDTGARGTINAVREFKVEDVVCRSFVTTVESYSGIANFAGETCLGADGMWETRKFGAA